MLLSDVQRLLQTLDGFLELALLPVRGGGEDEEEEEGEGRDWWVSEALTREVKSHPSTISHDPPGYVALH